MSDGTEFYGRLKAEHAKSGELFTPDFDNCVRETVDELIRLEAVPGNPGMLANKILSSKTRTFLGIMALSFDKGFDIAVVLTQGTKTLGNQMAKRIWTDFKPFRDEKTVQVFDILIMPRLTLEEISLQKVVIVAKKERTDMDTLGALFTEIYPELLTKRVLIINDETDSAAIRFARKQEVDEANQCRITNQIEELRRGLSAPAFLQVTATAHALYLQPGQHERRARICPQNEFRLLAMYALRVWQRYKRPFTVARLTFSNLDTLGGDIGATAAVSVFKSAVDAIVCALRVSDFVAMRGDGSAVIGFPETVASQVNGILVDRMREMIRRTTELPLELAVEVAEGDAIAAILN